MNTEFTFNGCHFIDNDKFKSIHSEKFNLFYNKLNGYAERWGRTRNDEDDPQISSIGPTIMDIELVKDIHPGEEENYKNELKIENHRLFRTMQILL